MASLGNNLKVAFLRGLEAVGRGASNMASNAHQKLNEINLETRRRELLSEIPVRALDLWQQGEPMPQPLGEMLRELSELDEELTVLRAQRYARVETEAPTQDEPSADELSEAPADELSEAPADELSEAPADELPAGEEAADEMEQEQAPAPVVPDPIDEGETGGNA